MPGLEEVAAAVTLFKAREERNICFQIFFLVSARP